MILVIEVLFLPFRWYCGGTWHVCGVLPRSQGSHGFVPWQGLWNWGPGFSSTPSWSWLSARSSCCCFFRYSKGLSLLLFFVLLSYWTLQHFSSLKKTFFISSCCLLHFSNAGWAPCCCWALTILEKQWRSILQNDAHFMSPPWYPCP